MRATAGVGGRNEMSWPNRRPPPGSGVASTTSPSWLPSMNCHEAPPSVRSDARDGGGRRQERDVLAEQETAPRQRGGVDDITVLVAEHELPRGTAVGQI